MLYLLIDSCKSQAVWVGFQLHFLGFFSHDITPNTGVRDKKLLFVFSCAFTFGKGGIVSTCPPHHVSNILTLSQSAIVSNFIKLLHHFFSASQKFFNICLCHPLAKLPLRIKF